MANDQTGKFSRQPVSMITPTSKLIAIGNRRLQSTTSNLDTIEALESQLTRPERMENISDEDATRLLLILRAGMKQDIDIAKLILDEPIPAVDPGEGQLSIITENDANLILRELGNAGFTEAEILDGDNDGN